MSGQTTPGGHGNIYSSGAVNADAKPNGATDPIGIPATPTYPSGGPTGHTPGNNAGGTGASTGHAAVSGQAVPTNAGTPEVPTGHASVNGPGGPGTPGGHGVPAGHATVHRPGSHGGPGGPGFASGAGGPPAPGGGAPGRRGAEVPGRPVPAHAAPISLPAVAINAVQRRLAAMRSEPEQTPTPPPGPVLGDTGRINRITDTGQMAAITAAPAAVATKLMVAGRAVMLVLVLVLGLLATGERLIVAWVGLLAIAALIATEWRPMRRLAMFGRAAEVVITCLAAGYVIQHAYPHMFVSPGAAAGAMLPYLVVPPVSAALRRRAREVVGLLVLTAVMLTAVGIYDTRFDDRGYVTEAAEWLLLATVAAATSLVLYRMVAQRRDRPQPYAEATRLLTQLRTVARQLPGATLDPGGLAEHLLDDIRAVARVDRSAVLCASGGSRLVVLAQSGATRVDWETSLETESLVSEAWATQVPQTSSKSQARSHPGGDVSSLVVPLAAGVRTVGLLTLEADAAGAYPPGVINKVAALAAPAALRLEAALLFDEVRSLATNEERQRLAREIHDGVAQELVMVGYGIDNALAVLPADAADAADELRALRAEVTRVITELRLSLFELRSEVDRHGGLAAAISEYARTVGASGGLRVHMSLDESTARLPSAVEAELLRIAQEAMTNARKHAGAANLWVTCTVDPPFAQVEVSDDGHGMADQRPDGRYGLAIMAERAERIRGRLEIRPRDPSGTTVAIVIGTSPRRSSRA